MNTNAQPAMNIPSINLHPMSGMHVELLKGNERCFEPSRLTQFRKFWKARAKRNYINPAKLYPKNRMSKVVL